MSDRGSRPPDAGLAGMRIGLEYGSGQDFAEGLQRALARGGEQARPWSPRSTAVT